MYTINIIYFLGWCKHKLLKLVENEKCLFAGKQYLGFCLAMLFIFVCGFQVEDVKYMPGVRCGLDIVTGRFEKFKEQMEERYELYYSEQKEITVKHIDYVPYVIIEDKELFANEVGVDFESEYYEKDIIHVVE